jgi:hypothetical protein
MLNQNIILSEAKELQIGAKIAPPYSCVIRSTQREIPHFVRDDDH